MRVNRAEDRTVWLFYHTSTELREERLGRCSFAEVFLGACRGLDDLRDETRVERVTGAMRGDFTRDRSSDQREVAEEIEDLVADEFVAEAERPIDDRVVVEDDAVLHSSTARESGGAKLFDLAHKSERPRG